MTISLVCLDMAGTTVADDGTVMTAFESAIRAAGLAPDSDEWDEAVRYVVATMGQSKIEVFTAILGERAAAHRANAAFENAYAETVRGGGVAEIPGAAATITELRESDIKVCLTTGFSPATQDAILEALGWRDLVDLALAPADAGRGRPWPDMIWSAALQLGAGDITDVAVVGDTPSDVESGRRAGAGLVVGVLTGTGQVDDLRDAGAHEVIDDVTQLPKLIEASTR